MSVPACSTSVRIHLLLVGTTCLFWTTCVRPPRFSVKTLPFWIQHTSLLCLSLWSTRKHYSTIWPWQTQQRLALCAPLSVSREEASQPWADADKFGRRGPIACSPIRWLPSCYGGLAAWPQHPESASPEPWSSGATDWEVCLSFLTLCSLTFQFQPFSYRTEWSQVAFMITNLFGESKRVAPTDWIKQSSIFCYGLFVGLWGRIWTTALQAERTPMDCWCFNRKATGWLNMRFTSAS